MRRYLGLLSYQGDNYFGYQIQNNQKTIQGVLESSISTVLRSNIKTKGSSRTDTGVHALCNSFHFDYDGSLPQMFLKRINGILPKDISLLEIREVDMEFHARFSATARHYQYIIYHRATASALMRGRATYAARPLDVNVMNSAAQNLVGEQDFSVFRAAGCQSKTPFRCINMASVSNYNGFIVLDIQANAFLQHMVRNITGALLEVGQGERNTDWINELIASKDRTQAGLTAAPDGLYMVGVEYPPDFSLPRCYESPMFLK